MVAVRVSFSALSLVNIRISLLLFPKPLAYCRAYFFRTQLGKHRNLLLLFRRLIFSTSALAFSHRTLIHSTQLPFFQHQISFPLLTFAEGYNALFTCGKHQNSLLNFRSFPISTTDFEKAASYFSTLNPAFSQAYVLRVQLIFFPVEPCFTALTFCSFRNEFLFRYMPSQKAITSYYTGLAILPVASLS